MIQILYQPKQVTSLYLDLMKKSLCDMIYQTPPFNLQDRMYGKDWGKVAHTMIGMKRLENLEFCVQDTLDNNVAGDFIETGVWRGGACILIRAILRDRAIANRYVWVVDSFEGFPPPSNALDSSIDGLHTVSALSVSMTEVMENFERYGL